MPRRKSLLIGLGCVGVAALAALRGLSAGMDSQADLNRLRELGVPLTLAELEAEENDRFPIEKVDVAVNAVRSHSSYLNFMKGSRYRMGTTKVDDLELALASQRQLWAELSDLKSLLWKVGKGFRWKRQLGYWRPESESELHDAVRFIMRRELQVRIANRDLSGFLETAALLEHVIDQVSKTPGNGSDLGRRSSYLLLTAYASALQAGQDDNKWISAIESKTRVALPRAEPVLLTHEVVAATLASLRRPQDWDHIRGARYMGVGWIFPSYRKQVEFKWAKLAREQQEAAWAAGSDYERFKQAYEQTKAKLGSDTSTTGGTVRSLWIDLEENIDSLLKERARWCALRAAIAVLQYRQANGSMPKSLSELNVPKDPFSKTDLRYVKTQTGFIVYSPGLDGDQSGSRSTDFGVEIDFSLK